MKLTVSSIGNWLVPVIAVLVLPGVGLSEDKASPNVESSVTVTFPSDAVQMKVPDSYTVRTAPDGTVAITPADDAGVVLRFTLHELPGDYAVEFVQSQAKKRNLQVQRVGNKSIISERGGREEDGREYDMTFWQIGFGDCLIVMSAEVDRKDKQDPEVVECLNGVPNIIESMQKK